MRKLLGLIGAFALTASTSSSIVACSNPAEPTYNTVAAAIQALNLTSYVKKGTNNQINETVVNIRQDAINVLSTNNYAAAVKFEENKLGLVPTKVINTKTKLALAKTDLKDEAILSLELTFTYNNEEVKAASSKLNVTTKTDQAIVDYINGYNFSKFTSKLFIAVGMTVASFTADVISLIQVGSLVSLVNLGSFSVFISIASFTNCNVTKKDGSAIVQVDLDKVGTLALTSNYKYGTIDKQQSVNFNVNISKIDISEAKVTYTDLPITLPDTSKNNLTPEAVTTITTAITKAIQAALVKTTTDFIATTDYEVTGIETTVKKGANFTNQTPVTFTIIAKSDSPKFTGKLENQTIKVTVSDKP